MMSGREHEAARAAAKAHLLARPTPTPDGQGAVGLLRLGLDTKRDGLLYVPATYRPERPAALVLLLHGAGGSAEGSLHPFQHLAEHDNVILLAVDSRRQTWDVLYGAYGPDVTFIDRALTQTFHRYHIDTTHVAVEGFSDGASYALSLGLTNGDLFTHIIAFSPGFMVPASHNGKPLIYVSHGDTDSVLPIDQCSQRIVPQLEKADYSVRYHEFHGPHTVPAEIAGEAFHWFAGRAGAIGTTTGTDLTGGATAR